MLRVEIEEATMRMSRVQFWVCAAFMCGAIACGGKRVGSDNDCVADESCECLGNDDCGDAGTCEAGVCVGGGDTDLGDVGSDAPIDGGDVPPDGADVPRDTDAGATNECGGSEPLVWMGAPAAVGDPCGDCSDGSLVCDGDDALGCEGTDAFNECGGCGELMERRGIPCGTCGVTWCEGGEVACVDDLGDDCPPPLSRSFRLEPSDGDLGGGPENDRFGWTVDALDDGGILIGAPADDTSNPAAGRVFHYAPDGDEWRLVQSITPLHAAREDDRFGESLATDGEVLVVGAPWSDEAATDAGVVYIFERDGEGWTQFQRLTPPMPRNDAGFGRSVGVSGDWIAVGEESRELDDGQVHIYRYDPDGWTLHTTLTGADDGGSAADRFGWSIAMAGDDLVVGALAADDLTGRAFAFRLIDGDWSRVTLDRHPDVAPAANFGYSVALDADQSRLAIGAQVDSAEASEGGAVYLYERTEDGWVPGPRIGPTVPTEPARFGSAAAFDGDRLYVGAFREPAVATRSGAVHTFDWEDGVWTAGEVLTAGEDSEGSRLGFSLAVTADGRAVSGAVQDRWVAEDAGAVYVFEHSGEAWEDPTRIVTPRALSEGSFARSVAIEGPVAVVGADESSRFAPQGGAVHVYQRVREGWEPVSVLVGLTPGNWEAQPLARFGNAIALDRDWLVVAARNTDAPDDRSGAVYVFARQSDEVTFNDVTVLRSPAPVEGGRFGASVAISNGRIIVGEDRERTDPDVVGTAWVFAWARPEWTLEGELPSTVATAAGGYGTAVAIEGESAAVSAPLDADAGGVVERFEFVDGAWTAVATIDPPEGSAAFGTALAFSTDELVVGASAGAGAEPASGLIHAFDRASNTWLDTHWAAAGTTSSRFGVALGVEGGLLVVGADRGDVDGSPDGTATVFRRTGAEWSETETLISGDEEPGESFGNAISLDRGRALVGAVEDDGDGRNAGAAYVRE